MLYFVIFLLFFIVESQQCHPQCRYMCDDKITVGECKEPEVVDYDCHWQCSDPVCLSDCKPECEEINCVSMCPQDQCESDSCPQCEILCSPLKCNWKCKKPNNCPPPMCELKCPNGKKCKSLHNIRPICSLQCESPSCSSN